MPVIDAAAENLGKSAGYKAHRVHASDNSFPALDATTTLLVLLPQMLPALRQLRSDLVHLGVVIVVNVIIGLHTSPYGMLPFAINGPTGISRRDMIAEIWPVLAMLSAALAVMVPAPETVLGLPRPFGRGG